MRRKIAWGAVLVVAVCWPFLLPGTLAARDMLVLDHPGVVPPAFGAGDLAPRNVPQDGVLALIGLVMPASWAVRALVVGAAAAAAWGGARAGSYLSMTLAVANPFVIERLLQGHWSLVVAAWLSVPIVVARRPLTRWLAIFFSSLTPTGGLFALLFGLVAPGRRANAGVATLAMLPWLVPSLMQWQSTAASPESAAAFAPRAEALTGTVGALLGLGGIWNADAVPASRQAGLGVFGIVLFCILLTALPRLKEHRGTLVLATLGLGGAIAVWLWPGALTTALPGGGLLRDGQKLVMLAIPAYVVLAGRLRPRLAWAGLACALLQSPATLAPIAPVNLHLDERLVARLDGRDTYFAARDTLTTLADGRVILDPYSKAASKVESGALRVDGVLVDAPSPRWVAAHEAWQRRDLVALKDLGVGAVVDEHGQVHDTGAPARPVPWLLHLMWLVLPLGLALASAVLSSPTKTPRRSAGRSRRSPRARK